MPRYATPVTTVLAAILLNFGSFGGSVTVPLTQFPMSPFVPALA